MGKLYQVKVFGIESTMKVIDLCSSEEMMKKMTVLQLKQKVVECFSVSGDFSAHDLQMIFASQRLEGDNTLLCSYGIKHLSVIQLVVKVFGGLAA